MSISSQNEKTCFLNVRLPFSFFLVSTVLAIIMLPSGGITVYYFACSFWQSLAVHGVMNDISPGHFFIYRVCLILATMLLSLFIYMYFFVILPGCFSSKNQIVLTKNGIFFGRFQFPWNQILWLGGIRSLFANKICLTFVYQDKHKRKVHVVLLIKPLTEQEYQEFENSVNTTFPGKMNILRSKSSEFGYQPFEVRNRGIQSDTKMHVLPTQVRLNKKNVIM